MSGMYGNGAKGKADKLFSELVRLAGACQNPRCRSRSNLQCAHIYSRKFNRTRTMPLNAVCLCASCHAYYTARPADWRDFLIDSQLRTADEFDELNLLLRAPFKVPKGFWEDQCRELRTLIDAEKERQECLLNGQ